MSTYNGLKTLQQEGLSDSELHGDLVYKFSMIVGKTILEQFKQIHTRYKKDR